MDNPIKMSPFKINQAAVLVILLFCFWQGPGIGKYAHCAPTYDIGGFYLGATAEDLHVRVEIDPGSDDQYFQTEADDVRLYFIKVEEKYRLYRIVKEESIKPENIKSVLGTLKARYGTPDKQQIKTSSVRSRTQNGYITTVKNRAIWHVSDTQEFVAEIESSRVVYDLHDNDPENLTSATAGGAGGEGAGSAEWKSDF